MKITIKEPEKEDLLVYKKCPKEKLPKTMTFVINTKIIKKKKLIDIKFNKFGLLCYEIK
jgi:hypothetical protein